MEKTRAELEVEKYRSGSACSQAVLAAYAGYTGLDELTVHKLGTGFGGGMGRKQYTCGAVSGAVAVLSLRYGNEVKDDTDAKSKTYALVHDYIETVEGRLGSSSCRELLGVPTYTEEEHAEAKALDIFEKVCPDCITVACSELEKILENE
ncbi:MAG: C_GCAxxG_C_C family protein [Spirochaetales bacterium]|nr:C_GCAxxG_C_C family protein [Spirochaetales bacterium]